MKAMLSLSNFSLRASPAPLCPCRLFTSRRPISLPACRRSQSVGRSAGQRNIAYAAAAPPATGPGKLLATSEISAFIPRQDLIDQLLRWAVIDAQDQGVANFGLPMTVKPTYRNEGEIWGFTVTVHSREGETLTQLSVRLDDSHVTKHEYMGRGADGFPSPEGGSEEIEGKNLEIRCSSRPAFSQKSG